MFVNKFCIYYSVTQTNIMNPICADIGHCLRLCQCTMHNISVIWHAAVVMVRVRGQLAPTSHVTSLATSAWGLRSARLGPGLGASLFVFSQLEFLPRCLNHAHVNTAQLSASSLEYHCFDSSQTQQGRQIWHEWPQWVCFLCLLCR